MRCDAEVLRRHFVAIATSDYEDPTWAALPGVIDEVKSLLAWCATTGWVSRRFTQQYPHLANNPTKRQIRDAFEDPEELWNHSDAAVVFVTGHGVVAHGRPLVVLYRTDPGQSRRSALRTSELIGWLADTGIEHLLIIVDLCYAGSAAGETPRLTPIFRRRGWRWPASRATSKPHRGAHRCHFGIPG